MLSDETLRELLYDMEADHVERTESTTDTKKFGEAICSFSNDLLDRRATSVLFIGVKNDGSCANVTIDERVVQLLLSFRRSGTILPPPDLTVRVHTLDGCRMAIVEVEPSDMPPVRYDGRVCVRAGPRRDVATSGEEQRLIERRRWGQLTFDSRPVAGASITDLDLFRFREEYLPAVIAPEILAENGRPIEQQLQAVGFIDVRGVPTTLGLLVCGNDPRSFIPGAYVQFVRYPGLVPGEGIQDQREISGPLSQMLLQLDEIIGTNVRIAADLSGSRQITHSDYPTIALQELVRNAVIHRTYEGTAAPVMMTWFADRVEIVSPGGPYGVLTVDNFPGTGISEARNPALAAAAKALGFVQRFGSGIPRAQTALSKNGNREAVFAAERNFIGVTVAAAE
jgi:ATP-dependent DNA helicase RecG